MLVMLTSLVTIRVQRKFGPIVRLSAMRWYNLLCTSVIPDPKIKNGEMKGIDLGERICMLHICWIVNDVHIMYTRSFYVYGANLYLNNFLLYSELFSKARLILDYIVVVGCLLFTSTHHLDSTLANRLHLQLKFSPPIFYEDAVTWWSHYTIWWHGQAWKLFCLIQSFEMDIGISIYTKFLRMLQT